MKIRYFLPLLLFVSLMTFLWSGLKLNPKDLPSALIGKAMPAFHMPTIKDPNQFVTNSIFNGKISILNVWASWCHSCRLEHEFWIAVSKNNNVTLIGLNYHDELQEAKNWIKTVGDPYKIILFDNKGHLGMELGVYGTPETFLIDEQGIIRVRHTGPLDPDIWKKKFLPYLSVEKNNVKE